MKDSKIGLLPWHATIWDKLTLARNSHRLPHALLLTGAHGIGKRQFAEYLAQALFCATPDNRGAACGHCRDCRLFQAGTHPDYRLLEPEAAGKPIRVDQIRAFTASSGFTAGAGGYQVVIIDPADAMNPAAANALLKTLEEPVAGTLLLLLSAEPGRLLPTIRSRCQRLAFRPASLEQAGDWLRQRTDQDPQLLLSLAGGAPLRALALGDAELLRLRQQTFHDFAQVSSRQADPVAVAAGWQRTEPDLVLQWLGTCVLDLARLKVCGEPPTLLNRDQTEVLQGLAPRVDLRKLLRFAERLTQARRDLQGQRNVQLLMEGLLVSWADAA